MSNKNRSHSKRPVYARYAVRQIIYARSAVFVSFSPRSIGQSLIILESDPEALYNSRDLKSARSRPVADTGAAGSLRELWRES